MGWLFHVPVNAVTDKERAEFVSAPAALNVADDGYVLENGSISVHGPAESLKLGAAANLLRQLQLQLQG